MKFLDEAKIYIKAGDGGDGALSFRHEKFIEFGGPDGGTGGAGGSIYAMAVRNVNTLIDYRYKQHFRAKKGHNGSGQNRTGKSSDDIVLHVPVGTQILDEDKQTEIIDLIEEGQIALLAKGGRGGLGNSSFKTSTNQAPRKFQKGELGDEKWIWLKLKLIADVGLVGLPNSGKSTFISAMTNAKAKIDDYPFSTITPQLGIIKRHDKEIVIADIPGLIENAHLGKGLGDKFLAHIERCSTIIHIIDLSSDDPVENYKIIRKELALYGSALKEKVEIIALNKNDIVDQDVVMQVKQIFENMTNSNVFVISALTKQGCDAIITAVLDASQVISKFVFLE
ncbi:MAG: GTPase ObgE [Holosporales bacterium]|jgi:GTP-binding protein|nr:GTPase ObgE [Holosporales bacterium]